MERETWDEFWLRLADQVATRSKCVRAQVGAVLTDDSERQIVGIGYNGAPAGFPEEVGETCADFCPRAHPDAERGTSYSNDVAVHAEVNALISSSREIYRGGTLYVTRACCWDCAKVVANSGITRVVMCLTDDDWHRDPQKSVDMLQACGVVVDTVNR